ncbi:MAG: hypothetical protein HN919_17075 [Verrucomicrobia bacterium]|jgi:hypothetical protein|nr:hypothetical protein [Verrucomicrobiota bacterium]MBT7068014.1 hypothetical protein [Verrucomicrobiota bacterium]MBT7698965.1 hypothetical protein [Verrucomicrobiota bacterium]
MRPANRSTEHTYFDIHPRIVRAGEPVEITIDALYEHVHFDPDASYAITQIPCRGMGDYTAVKITAANISPTRITFVHGFACEQEHTLRVETIAPDQTRRRLGEFKIYSLEEDLFSKRPLKGDFHMHSSRSDGKESPAYVAAACRRIGLDFMALTDHRQYAPSLEAQQAFADIETDFDIYPGEEIHPPGNPVHIVNFGGRSSVNALFVDEAAYRALIDDYADTLDDIPEGVDRYHYASTRWSFEKVHEAGGLSLYCHPYWMCGGKYYVTETLNTALIDGQHYDAYELIGGFSKEEADSNTLQVARYNEERAKGKVIPVVGVSDAHGCESGDLFGWYYTVVFAATPDLEAIHESIRSCHSVAIEAIDDETPRAYGPFRLVMYTLFLLREFFPIHDACCEPEGALMLAHIRGDQEAAAKISTRKGTVAALYETYWA